MTRAHGKVEKYVFLSLAVLVVVAVTAIVTLGGMRPAQLHRLAQSETLIDDTAGRPLDVHDGQIVTEAGRAVMIGTAYACGFRYNDPAASFCGFRSATSTDLVHWRDNGLLFDPNTAYWQKLCGHGSFGCYRPHEVYLASAAWVLWFNVPGGFRVLSSPHASGPFTAMSTPAVQADLPGLSASNFGDEALAVDPTTGVPYLAYTAIGPGNIHDIAVQRLDSTGRNPVGRATRLGQQLVEAPSLYPLAGSWWLSYSDPACPYCDGTGTSLAQAPSPLGPWHVVGSISRSSCHGQPAALNVLETAAGREVIYQSDLWDHGNSNEYKARIYLSPVAVNTANGRLPPIVCSNTDPP